MSLNEEKKFFCVEEILQKVAIDLHFKKKINENYFIFLDDEKKSYLFFCKITENNIEDYKKRITKDSFGPWPISKKDHIELLNVMLELDLEEAEYYVVSKKTCTGEKLRTLPCDKILLQTMVQF